MKTKILLISMILGSLLISNDLNSQNYNLPNGISFTGEYTYEGHVVLSLSNGKFMIFYDEMYDPIIANNFDYRSYIDHQYDRYTKRPIFYHGSLAWLIIPEYGQPYIITPYGRNYDIYVPYYSYNRRYYNNNCFNYNHWKRDWRNHYQDHRRYYGEYRGINRYDYRSNSWNKENRYKDYNNSKSNNRVTRNPEDKNYNRPTNRPSRNPENSQNTRPNNRPSVRPENSQNTRPTNRPSRNPESNQNTRQNRSSERPSRR